MTGGRFITVEGGEGAGKTTQVRLLAERLRQKAQCEADRGFAVVTTREPGGTPGAEAIRNVLVDGEPGRWDPHTEVLLHFAARLEHVVKKIRPALDRGDWVISDRFADSTRAYQGIVQGAGLDFVNAIAGRVIGDLAPDLTLLLDLPVGEGLRRAAERGGSDRYERMGTAFHERVREAFLELARAERSRIEVIDATGSENEVAEAVREAVKTRWPVDDFSVRESEDVVAVVHVHN